MIYPPPEKVSSSWKQSAKVLCSFFFFFFSKQEFDSVVSNSFQNLFIMNSGLYFPLSYWLCFTLGPLLSNSHCLAIFSINSDGSAPQIFDLVVRVRFADPCEETASFAIGDTGWTFSLKILYPHCLELWLWITAVVVWTDKGSGIWTLHWANESLQYPEMDLSIFMLEAPSCSTAGSKGADFVDCTMKISSPCSFISTDWKDSFRLKHRLAWKVGWIFCVFLRPNSSWTAFLKRWSL